MNQNASKKQSIEKENGKTEDNMTFDEIFKQNQLRELLNEAEKRSKAFKSKMVSQLYEVFKIFDIDHDGIISEQDLKFTFTSLGDMNVSDEKIRSMIAESGKPIDFETFVGLFESKEMDFDPEADLIKAFSKWDNENSGHLLEERFRYDLQSWGDRFSERDVDRALEEAPTYDGNGKPVIDYIEFCSNLCGLQNIRKSEVFQDKCLRNSRK